MFHSLPGKMIMYGNLRNSPRGLQSDSDAQRAHVVYSDEKCVFVPVAALGKGGKTTTGRSLISSATGETGGIKLIPFPVWAPGGDGSIRTLSQLLSKTWRPTFYRVQQNVGYNFA